MNDFDKVLLRKERKNRFYNQYNKIKNKYNFSDSQLAEILDCSISTLKDSLNCSKPYCNSDLMISFCHKFGEELAIDINYLYYAEESTHDALLKNNQTNSLNFPHSCDFVELTDKSHTGRFYGYYYSCNYKKIDTFILDIEYNDGVADKAVLYISGNSVSPTGSEVTVKKVLYGKPMLLKPSLVHICLQSKYGNDIFILDYQFLDFRSSRPREQLYCTYGSLLTLKRDITQYPEQKAFLMVNEPISPSNLHFIDGFLKLGQDDIIVPAQALDDLEYGLLNCSQSVKSFFEACPQINIFSQPVYKFSEKMLIAAGQSSSLDNAIIAKTILYLKERSINPRTINYPVTRFYSKFLSSLRTDENNEIHKRNKQNPSEKSSF